MKLFVNHGSQLNPHQPPDFLLEPETDFEERFLQAHFLRRMRGQKPCVYEVAMILDADDAGTGEVRMRCIENGLPGPCHWSSPAAEPRG